MKEIRRLADHPRMCCVYIAGDPLQVGMGHPVYHPIYAAAAEVELPILVHPHHRGEIAGTPSTMTENLSSQPLRAMQDISSLIVYGVFEKYPTLKVVLTEFGFTWLPTLMANLDRSWDALRVESLWVKEPRANTSENTFASRLSRWKGARPNTTPTRDGRGDRRHPLLFQRLSPRFHG